MELWYCFRPKAHRAILKKNPLKNVNIMLRLNPYAKTMKRTAILTAERRVAAKKEALDKKRGMQQQQQKA